MGPAKTAAKSPAAHVPAAHAQAPAKVPSLTSLQAAGNQQLARALGTGAKLSVSQPDDPEEREADRAADDFAHGKDYATLASPRDDAAPIRRQCAACDDEIVRLARAEGGAAGWGGRVAAGAVNPNGGEPLSRGARNRF